MDAIRSSDLGKLFLGGCGTQVGMVAAFIILGGTLALCSVCAVSNALTLAVTQEMIRQSANGTLEAASEAQVEVLQGEVESLVAQVELLQQAEPPDMSPAPADRVAPPKPIAIAHKGQVNLRSGPGVTYNRIGTLSLGESVEIVGRNEDSSWWLVASPQGVAWVSAEVVLTYNMNEDVPMVTIPALLVLPTTGDSVTNPSADPSPGATSTPPTAPTPQLPKGTPTAPAAETRIFVEDTVGYKKLWEHLSGPVISESFSPRGDRIAVIDGVSLFLVAGDGSYGQVLLTDNELLRPVGDAVWSPDGEYLAFVIAYKSQKCRPCRSVGLVNVTKGTIFYLETPDKLDSDGPRWTQDGRLLVNVHPSEPADGTTFVYDTSGQGKPASGVYVLSSSHDGQKWLPWRPGRVWRAGVSERPDTYYSN